MGAESAVAIDRGWANPPALWTGILAAPIAWALDLGVGYPLAHWACAHDRTEVLGLVTLAALVIAGAGGVVAWRALQSGPAGIATDDGAPLARARFMALLGLGSTALFALVIVASDMARWVLDGCR